MANNRMYLVHIPTGYGAYLGKRMAVGWYNSDASQIAALYEAVENATYEGSQDDFAVVLEDADGASKGLEFSDISVDKENGILVFQLAARAPNIKRDILYALTEKRKSG